MNDATEQWQDNLRTAFNIWDRSGPSGAASGCVGFEIGLALAFEHPEHARGVYEALSADPGWQLDTAKMAADFTAAFPFHREEVPA